MKKFLLLFLLLPFIYVNGVDYLLKDNRSCVYKFDIQKKKNTLLFFNCRIKLDGNLEAWGANALEIKLNGKTLTLPLNKAKVLLDPQCIPQKAYPVLENNKFFVKADSDWEVFNAPEGEVYSNTWLLNQVNKTELSNVFYSFAFDLKNLKAKNNVLTFTAKLPKQLNKYSIEIKDLQIKTFDNSIYFFRDWQQAIYPWSFPTCKEISNKEIAIAKNEHGFATFSIYNFSPQQFQLPSLGKEFQFYRLDNSNIPAKLKQANNRHIPNIGKPYVPELLTPLSMGSKLILPKGTTTFAVRLKNSKVGTYKVGNLPLTFKVLDITLPEATDLPVENTMYIMSSGTKKQNIYSDFREYGMSMMLLSPWTASIPMKIVNGKLVANFTKFDQFVKEYQKYGMNNKTLFFGTTEPIIKQIVKLSGQNEEGEKFQKLYKEFITLFFNHADELKLKVYLSLYDEANFQKEVWKKTKILTRVAITVPNSRLWSTVTELASAAYYYDTIGYRKGRDICITHPFQTYNKADDEILRGVLCPNQPIKNLKNRFVGEYEGITSYPSTNNRYVYGIRSRLGKIENMMGFAFWWGNMHKPNTKPVKCYYVTYPFIDEITQVRYSSVGWEAIRCGIDDMRYLVLANRHLTKKYGQEKAKQILNKLSGLPQYSAQNLQPEYFNNIRKQLISIIMDNK